MTDTPKDGGAAFPTGLTPGHYSQEGMTLRDWFAGQALAGDTANSEGGVWANDHQQESLMTRAKLYYRLADAMLEARK